ncbi:hypothetical protein [Streptomyces sp. NPDC005408]|uniref:hypothetical protein n=1 Tax=Streptomyces sp. NPDC005408 TaxID=3155341 RepID=UPI0033A5EA4E
MTTLTHSGQDAAIQHGANVLFSIAGRLECGQHLLTCRIVLEGEVSVPARVLVDVEAGPVAAMDVVGMEPEQMTAFAAVLGAGLADPRSASCEIMMHSTAPDTVPVEQAWEMVPALTPDRRSLRPLSEFEARHRYTPERADSASLIFRDAFELNADA